jgi:hypothetical protein
MVQKRATTSEPIATPFPAVHKYVLDKLGGRLDCVGEKGSYLKVFQSALHYYLNNRQNAKQKRQFFKGSMLVYWAYFFLLYLKTIGKKKSIQTPFVIQDPGRLTADGKSVFFTKIMQSLQKKDFTVLVRRRDAQGAQEQQIEQAEGKFAFPGLQVWKQMKDLYAVYQKAQASGRWNDEELHYLDSSLHSYLMRYARCLGSYNPSVTKKVFFTVHYINEGFICAMRDMGIQTVELQHGLISGADLYYVYPEDYRPWIKDMFLPDYLFMYGDLWRNRLLQGIEWKPEQLLMMGDYTELFVQEQEKKEKENIVLMCAQKFLSDEYLPWIEKLKVVLKNHPDWKMVVKLHPYEPKQDVPKYKALAGGQVEIVQSGSLNDWFSISKIQLSVYSTTFYDAIGYDIMNYALIHTGTYDAYVDEMIAAEVAVGIEMQDDPIARFLQEGVNSILSNKSSIYSQWDQQRFNHFLTDAE